MTSPTKQRRPDSDFTKAMFRAFGRERLSALLKAVEWFVDNPHATRGQVEQAGFRRIVAEFGNVGSFPNFRGRRTNGGFIVELISDPATFLPELEEVLLEQSR